MPSQVTLVSESHSSPSPALRLIQGDQEQELVQVEDLESDVLESLRKKLQDADKEIILEVINLPNWPTEKREILYEINREYHCRLIVNGRVFSDPFLAALDTMVGDEDPASHKLTLNCAIQTAAFYHYDDPCLPSKKINERLKQLKAAVRPSKWLNSQISQYGNRESEETASSASPAEMAIAFLEQHRISHKLSDADKVVCYFQGDHYIWDGRRWENIQESRFQAKVMAFLQTLNLTKLNERFLRDVISHLKGQTLLDCWDESLPFLITNHQPLEIKRPHFIVFSNGIIDVGQAIQNPKKTCKLLDFDPQYFNEVVLPYNFSSKAKCPLWIETIKEILPAKSKADKRLLVLQEFMGYTLLHDCRFQKFMILIGDGGNGKSTITETWQAMLGDENVSAVGLEVLGGEHRQWALKGKLANFSGELPYLGKINEGLLKRIVSGEPVDANRKHREPVKLRLQAKLIVNTNDLPSINDATRATWDRMVTIPFLERFRDTQKDDKDRAIKLREELPGIFLWSLKGLIRLLKNNKFTKCEVCEKITQEHRTDSDSVLAFVKECCQQHSGHVLFSQKLFETYRLFCERSGRNKPFGESEFGKRMIRAGFEKMRSRVQPNGKRPPGYRDIKLSEEGLEYWKQIKHKYSGFEDDDDNPVRIGYQHDQT
ncbi:hypothetical protein V6x_16500 [Gimesia chilikensis]|uniref:SF3 helicase domain-containing protein n=1 Tax=Gimesia chilikensis TaxID=2605989 RepID=A0A517W9P7_9PLAN|nr:phage/plasmid primase, P4 family [Gimesia chilikensis]QDU01967.1 hypothetical protein V6x_16500 [Gimesia chilikensis]